MASTLGPCGQPCDQPCAEPCDEHPSDVVPTRGLARLLETTLYNALDVCFDEVMAEPRKMLIVGGCRQRNLAQHLALLLPGTDMVLVDPEARVVQKAQEEICCRFKFVHAPLEALPFDTDEFDVTIAHNFLAYPEHWESAVDELGRVTRANLLISHQRPLLWALTRWLGPFEKALKAQGVELPRKLPPKFELLNRLYRTSRVKTCIAPYPFTVYMTAMNPVKEERLVLAP